MKYTIDNSYRTKAIFTVCNEQGEKHSLQLSTETGKGGYVVILDVAKLERLACPKLLGLIANLRNQSKPDDYFKKKIDKCIKHFEVSESNPIPLAYALVKMQTHCTYEKQKKWLVFSENILTAMTEKPSIIFDDGYTRTAYLVANNFTHFPVVTDKESAELFYQYELCDRQFGIVRFSEIFDEHSGCFQRYCQSAPLDC